MLKKALEVVVIGGGTGTFVTLTALKNYPIKLTAIVSMMDSGGSTGRLRDQLGVLPPGDIRQALVALSYESKIWRNLFTYRFEKGDLEGHTFGNIFLSTVEKIAGSLTEAISISEKLLKTNGNILPVTLDKSTLFAELSDGEILKGEARIDELGQNWKLPIRKINRCWISPEAKATKESLKAIRNADFIIVGPGDLHTSILPNLLVEGVSKEIIKSKSKKIFVVNLMTKRGQTSGYTAKDFVTEVQRYCKDLCFDYVLVNKGKISKNVVEWYKKTAEVEPVINNIKQNEKTKVVAEDVVSSTVYEKTVSDRIKRSLIRHDPEKLGKTLSKIILN